MPNCRDYIMLLFSSTYQIGRDVLGGGFGLLIEFFIMNFHDEASSIDRSEVLLTIGGLSLTVSTALSVLVCHLYYYNGYKLIGILNKFRRCGIEHQFYTEILSHRPSNGQCCGILACQS